MSLLFDHLRRLLGAALLLILGLCAAEVGLRWYEPLPRSGAGGVPEGDWPVVPSRLTRWSSLGTWSGDLVDVETREPFRGVTNSFGLRGPEPVLPKPAGIIRILCLGDETTLAAGLREEAAYPARLAEHLRATTSATIEVLNAGLPGGCPLTETILFRHQLAALEPDIVIVHVDVSDAADDRQYRPELRTDASGRPAAVIHPALDLPPGPLADWGTRFALVRRFRGEVGRELCGPRKPSDHAEFTRQLATWRADTPLAMDVPLPGTLTPLVHLRELLRPRQARLVLSTCPNAWQASELLRLRDSPGTDGEQVAQPGKALRAAATYLQVPVVDATAEFLRDPRPQRFYLGEQQALSRAGHDLYASVLMRALVQTGGSMPPVPTVAVPQQLR